MLMLLDYNVMMSGCSYNVNIAITSGGVFLL